MQRVCDLGSVDHYETWNLTPRHSPFRPLCAHRRTAKFQIRKYEPFLVAETNLDNLPSNSSSNNGSDNSSSSSRLGGVNPASAGMSAFNALAKYIFGDNAAGTKMAMTTPVFTSTDGTMQFVVQQQDQQVKKESICIGIAEGIFRSSLTLCPSATAHHQPTKCTTSAT